ncbi:MAG: flexitail domain-containing putative surface protein [Dehalococcoidia bacterium]
MKPKLFLMLAVAIAVALLPRGAVASPDPLTVLFALDTPNPQPWAYFGSSLAVGDVDGDGNGDIAVGALYEDAPFYAQGRAYVFSGADGSPLFTLNTPNPQAYAYFGESVAVGDVNGDGNGDIAVGASDEDVGAMVGQGRAYVFSGTDGSLLYTLTTTDPQWGAWFGHSVAVGDVDGDGKADIAAGAPLEWVGPNDHQGRAYVFSGADGSLLFTLDTPNPQEWLSFGWSVALGDVDGDGKADIAVGADNQDVGTTPNQGRAYVFSGADGSLLLTLDTPNPQEDPEFGRSVAVGDVDGDGSGDIVVGAHQEDVGGNPDEGRAYVFSGADGSLLFTLDTPNPEAHAWFGFSVAVGDINGDANGDIVVGAHEEDVAGNADQGRAYVFSGADASLLSTLDMPFPQGNAGFGHSVAVGDVTTDGNGDVAVGSPREDVGGNNSQGRAYVFSSVSDDLDGDGCTNAEELGPDPMFGGMRDPTSYWDFYDVPAPPIFHNPGAAARDGIITILGDAIAQLFYLGTLDNGPPNTHGADYDDDLDSNGVEDGAEYDRTPSTDPSKPWQSGPPSGAVTLQDLQVLSQQFGSQCSGAGGAPPAPPSPSQPAPLTPANAMAVDADPSTPFPAVESDVSVPLDATFSVNIDVTDSASAYSSYQYTATWNGAILSLVGVTQLEPVGTCVDPVQTPAVAAPNVFAGCYSMTTTTFTGATDTLTFECITPGTSPIHLVTATEEPLNFRTATLATSGHFIESNLTDASVTCVPCVFPQDADCDACWDSVEPTLDPPGDPIDPWDWYDVPVPTLFSGGHLSGDPSGTDSRDHAVSIINDVLAVLEYSGTSDGGPPNGAGRQYNQDVNGDTVDDGIAYDRSVGATRSGAPDGAVSIIVDVLTVLAQTGQSCGSTPP